MYAYIYIYIQCLRPTTATALRGDLSTRRGFGFGGPAECAKRLNKFN